MIEISIEHVKRKLDAGEPVHFVDVRESREIAICAMPGAQHIPMMQLFVGAQQPDTGKDAEIVVLCHTGVRSWEATQFLRDKGFPNTRSMAGGIDAWAAAFDPSMARY